MQPRIKFGLIAGAVGLALNICVSGFIGVCGPGVSLVAGAIAGYFAAQAEKAPTKGEGARLGAVSGAIAGGLVLVGQLLGGLGALAFIQVTGTPLAFGSAPLPSASFGEQIIYYISGLGTGFCIGLAGVALSALAAAGTGYLGTQETFQSPETPV